MPSISTEVRAFITSPLIAQLLTTHPEWNSISEAIESAQQAQNRFYETARLGRGATDLVAATTAALLAGKPITATFSKTAGDTARAIGEAHAAGDLITRVLDQLTDEQDRWPREHADDFLQSIRDAIDQAVTTGRETITQLGGIDSAEEAARAGKFNAWKEIEAAHTKFTDAKTGHQKLLRMLHEDQEVQASIHWNFENVAEIFPKFQQEGRVMDAVTKVVSDNRRPWPEPTTSMEHFIWLCRNPEARPWAPSPAQVRQREMGIQSSDSPRRGPKTVAAAWAVGSRQAWKDKDYVSIPPLLTHG